MPSTTLTSGPVGPATSERYDGRPIVYIRVSTDQQGTDRQDTAVPALAARDYPGVEPIIVRDDGVSAYEHPLRERRGGAELLRLIENYEIPAVFADSQDRLSRGGPTEWLPFAALCAARGTRVVAVNGGELDVSSENAELLGSLMACLAKRESAEKAHRVRSAARARAHAGYWVANRAPMFTRLELAPDGSGHKILATEPGFERIVRAFELVDAGHAINAVAKRLGINGKTLSSSVLGNRHYVGTVHYAGEWLPAKWEPFVDPALFERVQQRRERNAADKARHVEHNPFGSVLRCARCGGRLRLRDAARDYLYYRCRTAGCPTSAPAENLEAFIVAYLMATRIWIIDQLDTDGGRILQRSGADLGQLEQTRAERTAELERLVAVVAKGGAAARIAEASIDQLNGEIAQLDIEHHRASRDAATIAADLERLREALRFDAQADADVEPHIVGWWATRETREKRATLEALFETIELGDGHLQFDFQIPLTYAVPFDAHRRTAHATPLRQLGFGTKELVG
jgi:DNA invertase Pin-like site-specific DNA recombinase